MRKLNRTGAIAVVALAAAAAVVPQAFAHAGVKSTSPAKGATVKALPAFVTITFSEPIGSVTSVRVLDAKGKDHVVTAGLNPRNAAQVMAKTKASAPGTYTAKWAITADDGHKETGTFTFKVKK